MPETLVTVWEIWDALRARLDTPAMQERLGGAGRVYLVGDDIPDLPENAVGGRVVIVPTRELWEADHAPGKTRALGFLVRAELRKPQGFSLNAARGLDGIQREANALLQGWLPALEGFTHARVVLPFYLRTEPQPVPLYDQDRGVYYTSAEYRTEAARKTGGA